MAYLYGASIQGIQGFIFETNKLKEIVGASDLIERFCSFGFLALFANKYKINLNEGAVLRSAGGNIRIAFSNEEDVKNMVKYFPQYIMQKAYGITISQAVVKFGDQDRYLDKKDELEYKLIKARNQASIPLDSRFAFMKHTPRTGKPACYKEKSELFDKGNWQKKIEAEDAREELLGKLSLQEQKHKFPTNMEKISNGKNKIAIIHADGNKMGLMLQQMDKDMQDKSDQEVQELFKTFSTQITKSTNDAVKKAFDKSFDKFSKTIPFRPVVIGGDDVTIICSADYAVEFAKHYLNGFEENTEANFKESQLDKYATKLTACAGIAFCNEKYPFHYAYALSESLCSYAKEQSNREASCLAFHNIESSYFTDYKEYKQNELHTKTGIDLLYAPYYAKDKKPTIDTLQKAQKLFNMDDVPTGKFREWLSELHKNTEYANLYLERIASVMIGKLGKEKVNDISNSLEEFEKSLSINNLIDSSNKTPIYEILQLNTVISGDKDGK